MNRFAWASIDEHGHATGGAKGDQTGKEVKLGDYYDFGQNCVIRFRDGDKGIIAGKIARIIAEDDKCGYNQSQRATLYNACAKYDWDYDKIKTAIKNGSFPKCNTDCSAFVATCINVAYGKKLVACFATSTMVGETVNRHPDKFKKISVASAKKAWKKGDMPLRAGHHVIINI